MQWRDVAGPAAAVMLMAVLAVVFFWWWTDAPNRPVRPGIALRTPDPSLRRSLILWAQGSAVDAAAWQRMISRFEKETGEDVQLQVWDHPEEYEWILETGWAGDMRPDVLLIGSAQLERLRRAARIKEVDWSPAEVPHWVSAVVQPLLSGPNKIAAYPADFSVLVLFYNKAVFDRVGLAYPGDHWNWETLVAISRGLYRPAGPGGSPPPLHALEMSLNLPVWQALAAQASGGVYQQNQWLLAQPTAENGAVRGLQYLIDFFRTYSFAIARTAGPSAFERGESALLIGGAEQLFRLDRQKQVRWGVTALPKRDFSATTFDFQAWAVSAASHRHTAAQRLARLLAEAPARSDWLPAYLPEGAPPREGQPAALFYQQVEAAQPPFLHPLAPLVYGVVAAELSRLETKQPVEPLRMIQQINATLEKRDDWSKMESDKR